MLGAALVGAAAVSVVSTPALALDYERASVAELESIKGIGPALARRIVEERNLRGPFGSPQALQARVKGVGPAVIDNLRQDRRDERAAVRRRATTASLDARAEPRIIEYPGAR